jgi:hypothetical protein
VHEFDGVAEEDHALGVMIVRRRNEPVDDRGLPQHIAAGAITQVQIGDDERAHGGAR